MSLTGVKYYPTLWLKKEKNNRQSPSSQPHLLLSLQVLGILCLLSQLPLPLMVSAGTRQGAQRQVGYRQ